MPRKQALQSEGDEFVITEDLPAAGEEPRDATEDELREYALYKGNSTKAANIFAENNYGRGGYIVSANGKLTFSRQRFDEGNR